MKIGNFDLNGNRVFIVAELSANHGGSLEIAKESISAIKEIGADAVKIQTYTPDSITIDCNKPDFIIKGGTVWDGKTMYQLYKEAHTPLEWHEILFEYARKIGIDIFSTPFDKAAVDFLEKFNPSAYKIASFEINDVELIRYAASKKRPMIISTGIASIDEIQKAVEICRKENNEQIVLLKCTSAYPADLEEAKLKTISNMAETFGVVSGFSDHTMGCVAPIVAVSLGAKVIEKHFVLDKTVKSPDSEFSMDKEEFSKMIGAIRDAEKLIGNVDYSINKKIESRRVLSRSIYVVEDIKEGEVFSIDNLKIIRPGFGLAPKHFFEVLGKRANQVISYGTPLKWEMIK